MLQAFVWRRTHMRMLEPMPEAECGEILIAMQVGAILHGVGRHTSALQRRCQFIGAPIADCFRDEEIESLGICEPMSESGKPAAGLRPAKHLAHRFPFAVGFNRERDPSLVAAL